MPAKFWKTAHWLMKNVWTLLKINLKKPVSSLKKPTKNTMRCWNKYILLDNMQSCKRFDLRRSCLSHMQIVDKHPHIHWDTIRKQNKNIVFWTFDVMNALNWLYLKNKGRERQIDLCRAPNTYRYLWITTDYHQVVDFNNWNSFSNMLNSNILFYVENFIET